MFVVITAVDGNPGSSILTNAFCVAIAATPIMPTDTAIPLSGFVKGPSPAPSARNPIRRPAWRSNNVRRAVRVALFANKAVTMPSEDEHRYGQERSNLAEAASHVMSGEHHQITGYVRSKESSERKKSDNIDCTCCRAQDNWQQPIRCSDFHQLACAT